MIQNPEPFLPREEEEKEEECQESFLQFRPLEHTDGKQALLFSSWISNQMVFDDLRFGNCQFIQYDQFIQPVVVEQQFLKYGKAGVAWDCSFILAEYCRKAFLGEAVSDSAPTRCFVELGCGIGVAGLALAMTVSNQHA